MHGPAMQIDQDPGSYRVQKPDGTWAHRVNKPMCRWLGILVGGVTLMGALAPGETIPISIAVGGFLTGCLITLSLKSID